MKSSFFRPRATRALFYAAATMSFTAGVQARAPFNDVQALSAPELQAERGMFIAPDGTVIDLSIQMDTLVDGTLVLRSVLTPSNNEAERLKLYTQREGIAVAQPEGEWIQAGGDTDKGVSITFDRSAPLDLDVGAASSAPPLLVAVGSSAPRPDASGLRPIVIDENGVGATPAGSVTVMETGQGPIVTLAADTLLVKHILGSSITNIVANTANDRAIETSTMVNLSLANTAPLILSGSLLGLDDALLSLARRPTL